MSNTKSKIYTLPEPYQGFIRIDAIVFACAYRRIAHSPIQDRVVIRYSGDVSHASDFVIDCDSYDSACSIANNIRRMVEDSE